MLEALRKHDRAPIYLGRAQFELSASGADTQWPFESTSTPELLEALVELITEV